MAKVLGPMHSDRVKGSISGFTFREYRGMSTTSRRARPVKRATTALSNNRSIFGYLSKKWGSLSAYSRNLWYLYAVAHPRNNGMGGTFQLDGNQMFMSINHTVIRIMGEALELTDPPSTLPVAEVDTLTAAEGLASGGVTLNWTHLGVPVAAGYNEIQIAGPFSSPGRMSVSSRFRYLYDTAGDLDTFEYTLGQPGAWYWFRIRYVDENGELTNWVADQSQAKA